MSTLPGGPLGAARVALARVQGDGTVDGTGASHVTKESTQAREDVAELAETLHADSVDVPTQRILAPTVDLTVKRHAPLHVGLLQGATHGRDRRPWTRRSPGIALDFCYVWA